MNVSVVVRADVLQLVLVAVVDPVPMDVVRAVQAVLIHVMDVLHNARDVVSNVKDALDVVVHVVIPVIKHVAVNVWKNVVKDVKKVVLVVATRVAW